MAITSKYASKARTENLPPIMLGVAKSAIDLKKLSIKTAEIPFFIEGSRISIIILFVLAPRLLAESIILWSIFSKKPTRSKVFKDR